MAEPGNKQSVLEKEVRGLWEECLQESEILKYPMFRMLRRDLLMEEALEAS